MSAIKWLVAIAALHGVGCDAGAAPSSDSAPKGAALASNEDRNGADAPADSEADAGCEESSLAPTPEASRAQLTDEVALLWRTYEPDSAYSPEAAMIAGDPLSGFLLVPHDAPAEDARFPIEDPELGIQVDPAATRVAVA